MQKPELQTTRPAELPAGLVAATPIDGALEFPLNLNPLLDHPSNRARNAQGVPAVRRAVLQEAAP
jgi:hypothetical protein